MDLSSRLVMMMIFIQRLSGSWIILSNCQYLVLIVESLLKSKHGRVIMTVL